MQVLPDGVPMRAPDMPTERIIDRRQRSERRQSSERRRQRGIELEAPVEAPVEPWPVRAPLSWNRVVFVSLGTFVFGVALTMTIDRLTRHVRAEVVARPVAAQPAAATAPVAPPAPVVQPLPQPIPEVAPAPTPEPAPQVTLAPAAAPSTAIDLRPRRQPVAARAAAPAPAPVRARKPTAPAKWDPDADLGPLAGPAKPARGKWVDPFAE